MNFKKILSLALLLSSSVFAGECCEKTNFYILTESGWSWPTCPKFCIGYDGDFGENAVEQDSILFSSKPHYSYVISAEVGVEFNNWLSLGSSFNIRPLYEYCQSADAVGTDQARTIYFTLSNMSFMYVAAINRGIDPCWSWECGCFRLAPFVAGGVGLAYTTFGHFVAISDDETKVDAFGGLVVNEVLQEQVATTTSNFAWQVQVGLEASYAERLSFGVSYRFFNAGTWSTATDRCCINYWSNYEGAAQYPDLAHATLNPVSGKLRANELVFNLMINF
jgi:hypothetical protein